MRIAIRTLAAAFLVLCAWALPASAHGGGGTLDLDDLGDFVQSRIQATSGDPRIHAAYVRIGKALVEPGIDDLAHDVRRLQAVARELAGPLSLEGTLDDLFQAAMVEARAVLDGLPGDIEGRIDAVEEAGRPRIERLAVAARARAIAGRSPALTDVQRLKAWRKAALGYRYADAKADAAIDRQGGPVPTTFPAEPGRIYTVAGRGTGGYNGDGLPARRSFLYWAEEIKFGPDGRLYVLDWNNHMLRRIEADGTLTRVFGAGVPGDSEGDPLLTQLNHPSAIDFDAAGRIYMAAWHNHKVKVYDPTGASPTVYTIAGSIQGNSGDGAVATDARFNLLPGVLLLPPAHPFGGGDLLCTDAANQCVRVVKLGTAPQTATNVAGTTVNTGTVDRMWGTGIQGHGGDGTPASGATVGFSKAQNAESDGRMALAADGSVFLVSGVEHVIRKITTDGVIHTVAGNGTPGHSGDAGQATSAQLNFPSDVALAPDGSFYVSDQNNHCIRKVAADGTISTVVGVPGQPGYEGDGGAPAAARIDRPTGMELDAEGNLWFCDKDNSVLRVVTASATTLQVPREPYSLPVTALGKPPAKGPAGTIDTFAGTGVSAFTGDGRLARETDFYWPQDVALHPANGQLYIVDWNNHKIRRVEDDGTVRTVVGGGELGETDGDAFGVRMNHPTDVTFNPVDGDLYIASWHTDKVKRLIASTNMVVTVNKPGGRRAFTGDEGPVSNAELNLPSSVKFDAAGNMYIADAGNRRLRRVNQSDQIIDTFAGTGTGGFNGDGIQAVDATLNLPVGQSAQPAGKICLDPTGRYVYVADTNNHRVRRIDQQTGLITTVAGTGTSGFLGDGGAATDARLNSPVDVDCDGAGNLYICDRDNHCVRKVTVPGGVITTVAGIGGLSGYAGDQGAATSARLNLPCGILVDRATGRLFVADTFNSVVRVVWE